MVKSRSPLSKMSALPSQILLEGDFVLDVGRGWRGGICGSKLRSAGLAVMNITQQVKVMIEKI